MPRFVAFLRAINVGGHVVTMDELKKQFVAAGFTDVETFIASGNVVFTAKTPNLAAIERKIEDRLRHHLGYEVKTFVRSSTEVAAIATHRAFDPNAAKTAHAVYVGFFSDPLGPPTRKAVLALKSELDDFHVRGREIFWLCKKTKLNESKINNAVLERCLKAPATFRNLNTIVRLTTKHGFKPE